MNIGRGTRRRPQMLRLNCRAAFWEIVCYLLKRILGPLEIRSNDTYGRSLRELLSW